MARYSQIDFTTGPNPTSLWWIISTANYNTRQDSLTPPVGSQIRIPAPSRVNQIISNYEVINS